MPENSQRHRLPEPGMPCMRASASTASSQSLFAWPLPAWPLPAWPLPAWPGIASEDRVAMAASPLIHAARLHRVYPPRGPAGPPYGRPGPRGLFTGLDRLGGGPHRERGQGDEDAEPGHQADGQAGRHREVADHVRADLYGLVGRGELADLAQEPGQREPQAAEDREHEVDDERDRLDLLRREPVADGHGQRGED